MTQRLGVVESFILLVVSVGLLATGGGLLQWKLGFPGVLATELLIVLLPTVAAMRIAHLAPAGLGLVPPRGVALLSGALVGAGGFYLVSAGLEAALERVVPLPPEIQHELERLMFPVGGARPLWIDLAVLAVAPAVCEELLFRGALLASWRPAGRAAAIGGTALAFGCFHLSLYKLAPTVALGILLGGLAWRSRSIFPGIVAHAVNNTLVIVLVRAGVAEPPAIGSRLGLGLAGASLIAVVAGLALAAPKPVR